MIQFDEVTKTFAGGGRPAVDGLRLNVRRGELMVLLGESGCGKTTTLKMVNRLIEPTSGVIRLAGVEVARRDPVELRRGIGYVFQDIGLFPHLTIERNVGAVLHLLGRPEKAIRRRVAELLEMVGLAGGNFGRRYPRELSGGQQQRVGVARALAAEPSVVLMDEPFGALDPLTRADLREEYARIHSSLGLTTLLVTHDIFEAIEMADRIAVMKDGRILQSARPSELVRSPADPYVESLLETPRRQIARFMELQ
ncbi:MAG TPA: ATP-binding cassette domain-containing protein [Acidobacteriota bacterium]|nr:ATP-binding cassette domain-containing protein [Acidobacteriota bacterium]